MTRLILLSGVGGSGTTTLAAATADALRAEGMPAVLIDGTGDAPVDPSAQALLAAPARRLLGEAGADAIVPEAWVGLAGLSSLSVLLQAEAALGSAGAVVIDLGGHSRAREVVQLPGTLMRLLDAALTPRLAMRRPADGDEGLFESLSAMRSTAVRLDRMLTRPHTTMRLVTQPKADGIERTAAALAVMSTLGVGVDGVVVNRYPRSKEGWPKAVMSRAAKALATMADAADGVPVWASTARLRPAPKGVSPLGPIGRVRVLDAEQLTVVVGDGELSIDLPLVARARDRARVGVQADSLVIEIDGVHRWLPLPPVLRRCRPLAAERTETGVRVVFVPDPATWRGPVETATEVSP